MAVDVLDVIATVVSFLVGLGGASKYYRKFKRVVVEGADVFIEMRDLMKTIKEAVKDDNITKEEMEKILDESDDVIKEYNEFVEAIKAFRK
ncbi:MAG: hypothetical protein ACTSPB_11715 [Candidatus Thorarchaeota archaeon]